MVSSCISLLGPLCWFHPTAYIDVMGPAGRFTQQLPPAILGPVCQRHPTAPFSNNGASLMVSHYGYLLLYRYQCVGFTLQLVLAILYWEQCDGFTLQLPVAVL
jgi:hypothetical protein